MVGSGMSTVRVRTEERVHVRELEHAHAPQGQRRKRAKPAPAAPLYRTRDAETAPSVFAQPGGSMFSPAFAQGMMLAELNASRAREQSERESQARFLGFMGVPK